MKPSCYPHKQTPCVISTREKCLVYNRIQKLHSCQLLDNIQLQKDKQNVPRPAVYDT